MEIFIIIICLFFTAYFSSLIVAYTYSNKIFINLESKKQSITSYTLKVLSENPRLYISSLKAGNTISIVFFSFYYIQITEVYLNTYNFDCSEIITWLFSIATATALVYIFSKFIPQTFARPFANQMLINSNFPIQIILKIFKPLVNPLLKLSDWCLINILKLTQDKENQLLSISELGSYITKQIETAEDQKKIDTELQILKNALSFTDVIVKQAMVPKLQIESIAISSTIEEINQKFIDTGYSRLLVYENNENNIIGYIHVFEILENPKSIKDLVFPIETVTEKTLIKDLFKRLTIKRKSIAKVIDASGQYIGIITMEDIIEELFGEIDDEHDENSRIIEKQIAPNKYIISARLEVEYLNKKFNLNLAESKDYNNLSTYILHFYKKNPKKGEEIKIENKTFKILSTHDKKIDIIEITTTEG